MTVLALIGCTVIALLIRWIILALMEAWVIDRDYKKVKKEIEEYERKRKTNGSA